MLEGGRDGGRALMVREGETAEVEEVGVLTAICTGIRQQKEYTIRTCVHVVT